MIWCGIFQKAAIFVTCPLFSTVKDVCQGGLRIVVCQGVQTASTDIFGRTSMRRVPKIRNKNIFLYQGCLIQHRNWPLRSTTLNAHGTNASPDRLCTRTHTNEAFSCLFCCNSFRVDRARRGNACLEAWLGRV